MHGEGAPLLPYAPPFLRAGSTWLSHTAAITAYLGEKLGLAPHDDQERITARCLALTIADLVTEAHNTHHPITIEKAYEDQREPALARAQAFRDHRMPRFMRHFERTIALNSRRGGGEVLVGAQISYVDLSVWHVVEGLRYAFPTSFARLSRELPKVMALHSRISMRTRLRAYLDSDRRVPFSEDGIFRRYPELDA